MGASKGKVIVGMSGGVDSSVAALLLKQQGYDVIGVTMEIWPQTDPLVCEQEGGCCGLSAVEDARKVASVIGIPHYVMNFRRQFEESVITDFVSEYRRGRTPNPCIICNRIVKWEALLNKSLALGADYIATGHYARIERLENGRVTLRTSLPDRISGRALPVKDQTYALYSLTQNQLEHTLMPVGDYTKDEIRTMAEEAGLPVAHKPDSQDICFVPDGDYASFIRAYTGEEDRPGNFVDEDGRIVGRHRGIIHYTVGQRKGLGLAMGHPVYVRQILPETNEVIIGEDRKQRIVRARNISMMAIEKLPEMSLSEWSEDEADRLCRCGNGLSVQAKIRYNHRGAPAIAFRSGEDEMTCIFEEPQRAVTPGQSLVLYDAEGYVLGGGIIDN